MTRTPNRGPTRQTRSQEAGLIELRDRLETDLALTIVAELLGAVAAVSIIQWGSDMATPNGIRLRLLTALDRAAVASDAQSDCDA